MKKFINKLNIKMEIERNKTNLIIRILLAIVFAITIMLDSMIHFDGNIANKLNQIKLKKMRLKSKREKMD